MPVEGLMQDELDAGLGDFVKVRQLQVNDLVTQEFVDGIPH